MPAKVVAQGLSFNRVTLTYGVWYCFLGAKFAKKIFPKDFILREICMMLVVGRTIVLTSQSPAMVQPCREIHLLLHDAAILSYRR